MPDTELKLQRAGDIALVTIDNGADHTKPTFFGRTALESLGRTLDELERGDYAALVLTGKPFVFAAGADVTEFPGIGRKRAVEGSRAGHELFGRLAALPFPTVAAINGACLGGGVEIALNCDARTISSAVRHVGCPEVFLGLIPGWGGTQLLPPLVGLEGAIRVVVSNPLRQNRLLDARRALELGLADRLLEPAEFLDESIAFARELAERGLERPEPDLSGYEETIRRARSQLDDSLHGAAPAPYRALDLIEGACSGWSLDEGYRAEEEAVGDLLPGPQAQASIYAFDLVERRVQRGAGIPDTKPRALRKVGIVGAGLMATQLATLLVRRLELPLVLRDLRQEIVDEAVETVRAGLPDSPRKAFLGSLVTGSTDPGVFAGCDLVLEAVFEELDVKQRVFAELEDVVSPACVLATNTSSLSVTAMAAGLRHPGRVVGVHFFNPVAALPLVELVRGAETDDETLATAWALTKALRKRAVLVRDAPAFVVNRVLTRMMTVTLAAIEAGNPVEEVDEALLSLGLPMAPSVLLQMVGPRVARHVLGTLHDAYPERFPLSRTLDAYAEGRDEVVLGEARPLGREEIRDEALAAIADEIRHLLDEGVVADAADVDTTLLLGAGWPFFLGGITKRLEQAGLSVRPEAA